MSRSSEAGRRRAARQAVVGLGLILVALASIAVLSAKGASDRGLRAQVLSTRRAEPGDTVAITVTATDTFGAVKRIAVDFGDGHEGKVIERDPGAACRSDFARAETFDLSRTYTGEGLVNVRARVTSGGCGAPDETVEAVRTIEIKPLERR